MMNSIPHVSSHDMLLNEKSIQDFIDEYQKFLAG